MLCDQPRDPNLPQAAGGQVSGTLGLNDLKPRYQWPYGSFKNIGQSNQYVSRGSTSRLTDQLRTMGRIDRLVG